MTLCQYPGCTNPAINPGRKSVPPYCLAHKREIMNEWYRKYYLIHREKLAEQKRQHYQKKSTEKRNDREKSKPKRYQLTGSMADIRLVEDELGIHRPTKVCRRCGQKLPPVNKRPYMSYCCREHYLAAFRSV